MDSDEYWEHMSEQEFIEYLNKMPEREEPAVFYDDIDYSEYELAALRDEFLWNKADAEYDAMMEDE